MSIRKKLALVIAAELVAGVLMCWNIVGTVEYQNRAVRQHEEALKSATLTRNKVIRVMPEVQDSLKADGNAIIRTAWFDQIRTAAENLEYVPAETEYNIEDSDVYQIVQAANDWDGPVLSRGRGTVTGPNGRETYYNLNMSVIVRMMRARGNEDAYWVRSDGVKMLGNYVMVAANLNVHPRGSIVHSSVGMAIVCDTGGFAKSNPQQLDIAAAW